MSDFFDTSRVRDEPAYWDALAERIAVNAGRHARASAVEWLAHSRASLAATSLLAAAALLFLLSADGSSSRSRSADWTQALAPADDVGKAIMKPDGPPAIGALLFDARRGT